MTLARWQDIWLHEGFACYSEWLWSEASGGESADTGPGTTTSGSPELDQDLVLADPGPELMFDDRVYKRGALTLHALRLTVGDEAFFALLEAGSPSTRRLGDHRGVPFVRRRSTGAVLDDFFDAWLTERAAAGPATRQLTPVPASQPT